MPSEKRIHERYVHHFRQLWEEEFTSRGSIQLQCSGTNQEEGADPPNVGQPQSSNSDHIFSIGEDDQQLPLQSAKSGESGFRSNPFDEDFPGDFQRMDSNKSSGAASEPSMSALITDYLNPTPAPLTSPMPDSAFDHRGWPQLSLNVDFAEGSLDEFWGYEAANILGRPTAPGPELDQFATLEILSPSEQLTFDHNMGGELLLNGLQTENERPEAIASWRTKDSGNEFLRTR